ncbi:hypothetical protein LC040_06120 [Bacillus tianshenii]|nr:hypothetical protein LC040_06120 [Bacillus tianshenii]
MIICYKKSDLSIVGTVSNNMSPQEEITKNVIPNFGGKVEDYSYIATNLISFHLESKDGEIIVVDDSQKKLFEQAKTNKRNELHNAYQTELHSEIVSSILGDNGKPVVFGYSAQDQMNYNKFANRFALDENKSEIMLGTRSHGVITLSKEDFIIFTDESEQQEMRLYMKWKMLDEQAKKATTQEELVAIEW